MTDSYPRLDRVLANAHRGISELTPYEPGRPIEEAARALGLDAAMEFHKLASNENALGPSPLAVAAVQEIAPRLHLYPDGGGYALLEALSRRLGVSRDHLVLTNGSNEGIELLGHLFLGSGAGLVMADRAFAVYRLVAALFGAEAVTVPMREHTHDLPAMARAVTDRTRLLFIANPNNPTGTRVSQQEVETLLNTVPDHVAVVLDEAYLELLPEDQQPDSLQFVREGRPVIILRTFSKTYGLAGLRIGYAVAPPPLIRLMHKARQPFNVNAAAQAAALAALEDQDFVRQTRSLVADGRASLESAFRHRGLTYVPSVTNFVLVRVGDGRQCFEQLQRRGIIVRPMDGYNMPEWIRVTVGTPQQNTLFLAALEEYLP